MRRWRPESKKVSYRLFLDCFERQVSQAIPLCKSSQTGRGENFVLSSLAGTILRNERGLPALSGAKEEIDARQKHKTAEVLHLSGRQR